MNTQFIEKEVQVALEKIKSGSITLITKEIQTLKCYTILHLSDWQRCRALRVHNVVQDVREAATLMNSWWEHKWLLSLSTAIWQ